MTRQLMYLGIQSRQAVTAYDLEGRPHYIEFEPGLPREVHGEAADYLLKVAPDRFQDETKKPEPAMAASLAEEEALTEEDRRDAPKKKSKR